MQWLQSLFEGQSPGVTLTAIVVGLVVALVLLFWIFRKIAGTGGSTRRRGQQPRLSVSDAAPIDDKRRLVIVRRDDVEHLIMIGGASDILIEANIKPPPMPELVDSDYPAQDSCAGTAAVAGTAVAAGGAAALTAPDPAADHGVEEYPVESAMQLGADEPAMEPEYPAEPMPAQPEIAETEYETARFAAEPEPPEPDNYANMAERSETTARMPEQPEPDTDFAETPPPPEPAFESAQMVETEAPHPEPQAPEPAQAQVASEPPEERKRQTRDGSVEDEMQRLLDELSNA